MAAEWSLRRRIAGGLFAFATLLTAVVLAFGYAVHESSEQLVWRTLLDAELDHFAERRQHDPDYRWHDSRSLKLYVLEDGAADSAVPARLAALRPGVHDEVRVGEDEYVVLVRAQAEERLILALDIRALEAHEAQVGLGVMALALGAVLVLGLGVAWGVDRLVAPLRLLAEQIAALRPDPPGARLPADALSVRELNIIRDALNGYLERNERFVEREREFIDLASHELRTPIAVIRGAAEIAASASAAASAREAALQRILATTADSESLIALLLALARDPQRLRRSEERVALAELLPQIVDDHRHLCQGKELEIGLSIEADAEVDAPAGLLRVAIGNLLRNAIEHSDRGRIGITVQGSAVAIEDPGHGMSAEEISRAYARSSRAGGRSGGIGLELIDRLCRHLGWQLAIAPRVPQGTRVELRLPLAATGAAALTAERVDR